MIDENARNGSVLIVTLWIAALVTVVALNLEWRVRLAMRAAERERAELEARETLSALGRLCASLYRNDNDTGVDSLAETWNKRRETATRALTAGVEGADVGAEMTACIQPADESGKINVNRASKELLVEVFRETGAGVNAEEHVLAILDWRDPDGAGLAEADAYDRMQSPFRPPNADLTHIEELAFVAGINPALLFGEDENGNGLLDPEEDDGDVFLPADNMDGRLDPGLINLLTVHGEGEINANTAPVAVLRAVLRTALGPIKAEALAEALVARRAGPDAVDGTDDDRPFESYEAIQALFAAALGADEAARVLDGVNLGVKSVAARFRLTVRSVDNTCTASASMIAARAAGTSKVVEWREE